MSMQCAGWFLVGGGSVYGFNRHGHNRLLPDVRPQSRRHRGIPAGAMCFESEAEAQRELRWLDRWMDWPVWTPNARAEYRTWR
jgi:hypothetical protein